MTCSFCVENIKKALCREDGVQNVNVSLAHEEALIEYNPTKVSKGKLERTVTDLGYTIRDPRRAQAFQEQKQELKIARRRLISAAAFTGASLFLMALRYHRTSGAITKISNNGLPRHST